MQLFCEFLLPAFNTVLLHISNARHPAFDIGFQAAAFPQRGHAGLVSSKSRMLANWIEANLARSVCCARCTCRRASLLRSALHSASTSGVCSRLQALGVYPMPSTGAYYVFLCCRTHWCAEMQLPGLPEAISCRAPARVSSLCGAAAVMNVFLSVRRPQLQAHSRRLPQRRFQLRRCGSQTYEYGARAATHLMDCCRDRGHSTSSRAQHENRLTYPFG